MRLKLVIVHENALKIIDSYNTMKINIYVLTTC